jgi:FkbH-like protein
MYRTVRRVDEVKLVIVDLDDTLWRGVVAEADDVADDTIEGWPMGIIEALQFLKKRGILLGIISKNDEARIQEVWPTIFRGRLRLDDFAVRKINWRPKADNMEEILAEVNLLSRNVLFVDDNPAERESIRVAFPDVRVLGGRLYDLKRTLLWAPETQVPFISNESARRTRMVQGQISRERERKMVPRQQFLANLGIEARVFDVRQDETARISRSTELLNKTNQFNTTGRRWADEHVRAHFDDGGSFVAFEVRDKFTDYGIVGVVVLRRKSGGLLIEQVVMSCRVFGLDVEQAVMSAILERTAQAGERRFSGLIQKLSANQPSWDLFERLGFHEMDRGVWSTDGLTDPAQPSSVSVRWEK